MLKHAWAIALPVVVLIGCADRPERYSRGDQDHRYSSEQRERMTKAPRERTPDQSLEVPSRREEARTAPAPQPVVPQQQEATQQPAIVQERTVVIIPAEPADEGTMRRDRESEDVALRQRGDAPTETAKIADVMEYEPDFLKNYQSNFADSGYAYEQYRPAYYYGYELANASEYRSIESWSGIEAEARRNWNEGTMGPWERYKDAVRYAWERVRQGKG